MIGSSSHIFFDFTLANIIFFLATICQNLQEYPFVTVYGGNCVYNRTKKGTEELHISCSKITLYDNMQIKNLQGIYLAKNYYGHTEMYFYLSRAVNRMLRV